MTLVASVEGHAKCLLEYIAADFNFVQLSLIKLLQASKWLTNLV